ncbi:unnamed protein product [Phytomonas sp. Hart1]|nr:unnamed protein product [Phytomonas sp. Hart1]|eukprot:CCW70744.1 unnamed protein product [Phytomonas sp. isolate Hart1]
MKRLGMPHSFPADRRGRPWGSPRWGKPRAAALTIRKVVQDPLGQAPLGVEQGVEPLHLPPRVEPPQEHHFHPHPQPCRFANVWADKVHLAGPFIPGKDVIDGEGVAGADDVALGPLGVQRKEQQARAFAVGGPVNPQDDPPRVGDRNRRKGRRAGLRKGGKAR